MYMPLNHKILDVIACPVCKGKLAYDKDNQELICKFHKVAFPIEDGVPIMLVSRARPINQEKREVRVDC